jgi:hypothetical protein
LLLNHTFQIQSQLPSSAAPPWYLRSFASKMPKPPMLLIWCKKYQNCQLLAAVLSSSFCFVSCIRYHVYVLFAMKKLVGRSMI